MLGYSLLVWGTGYPKAGDAVLIPGGNGELFEGKYIEVTDSNGNKRLITMANDIEAWSATYKPELGSHSTLDMLGATPGINLADGADIVNAAWYLGEGKGDQAYISLLAAFKDPAVAARYAESLDSLRIINKKYSGQVYELSGKLAEKYPKGVNFTKEGFPDFNPYAKVKVEVSGLTGKASDFTMANKAAGLKTTPTGYTWHHVENGTTMILVPTDLHQAVRHTGGASLIERGIVP